MSPAATFDPYISKEALARRIVGMRMQGTHPFRISERMCLPEPRVQLILWREREARGLTYPPITDKQVYDGRTPHFQPMPKGRRA